MDEFDNKFLLNQSNQEEEYVKGLNIFALF